MDATTERTGVMVVRIWTERPGGRLQARLTETLDVLGGGETVQTATSVEQILAIVRSWCEAFLALGD